MLACVDSVVTAPNRYPEILAIALGFGVANGFPWLTRWPPPPEYDAWNADTR